MPLEPRGFYSISLFLLSPAVQYIRFQSTVVPSHGLRIQISEPFTYFGDDPKHHGHMLYSINVRLPTPHRDGVMVEGCTLRLNSRGSDRAHSVRGAGRGAMRIEAHLAKLPLELL